MLLFELHCLPLNRNYINLLQISRRTLIRIRIRKTINISVWDLVLRCVRHKLRITLLLSFRKLAGAPSEERCSAGTRRKKVE